jgi:NADH-quinone oxidoreductase subunit K
MVPVSAYVVLSAVLFTIGAVGVLIRRNLIIILLSIEIMLNAANINFVAFSHYFQAVTGQVFVFFVLTVAAAEVAVGLAIIIALYRGRATVNVEDINLMKW